MILATTPRERRALLALLGVLLLVLLLAGRR